MLTKNEKAALDRAHTDQAQLNDLGIVYLAMTRLFPPGWDDPVTDYGLAECGFISQGNNTWGNPRAVFPGGKLWADELHIEGKLHRAWRIGGAYVVQELAPRNMLEVWHLLQRCGLPSPLNSEEST